MEPTFSRPYDRSEITADAIVHGLGLLLAVIGVGVLVTATAWVRSIGDVAAAGVYGAGLVAALTASTIYNLWPVSPRKWLLRRFDHSAIFVLIAATYTPFLAQMPMSGGGGALAAFVWGTALAGVVLKCAFPGRWDRLAVLLYLALGWSGVVMWPTLQDALGPTTLWLILAGGLVYSAGVVFHLWERLRYQNAIWHLFVLVGAAVHYGAVFNCLVVKAA